MAEDLIQKFWEINDSGTMLNVYRKENQILLQGFKPIAVRKWKLNSFLVGFDNNVMVIELRFNKNKKNNDLNFERFFNSTFYDDFVMEEPGVFLSEYKSRRSARFYIIDLLYAVYGKIELDIRLDVYRG